MPLLVKEVLPQKRNHVNSGDSEYTPAEDRVCVGKLTLLMSHRHVSPIVDSIPRSRIQVPAGSKGMCLLSRACRCIDDCSKTSGLQASEFVNMLSDQLPKLTLRSYDD